MTVPLARGPQRRGLAPHYLPVLRLADDAVVAVEALPAETPVGRRDAAVAAAGVLRQVCAHAAGWRRGLPAALDLQVGVDVGRPLLSAPDLVALVGDALAGSGLPPDALVLEVDEVALVDVDDQVVRALGGLREIGVGLALDHFGRVAAPLRLLQELPLTQVKVTGDLLADPVVARAVLHVSEQQGLEVVAVGVRDDGQVSGLRAAGVRLGQGPGLSAARSPEQVEELLVGRSDGASLQQWAALLERRRADAPRGGLPVG